MKLRSIIVNVDQGRRIIVRPNGCFDLEAYVHGIGWVLDNDAYAPDLASVLTDAGNALALASINA